MSFDLNSKLLQMLHNGSVDRATEVGMLVRDRTSLVAYLIVHVLISDATVSLELDNMFGGG